MADYSGNYQRPPRSVPPGPPGPYVYTALPYQSFRRVGNRFQSFAEQQQTSSYHPQYAYPPSSQPTMQPTQRQTSGDRADSSHQRLLSEPVYHYLPQDQPAQSYQQPSMTPGSYHPDMPPNQQAQAYQPSQAAYYPPPRFPDAQQQQLQQVPVFTPSRLQIYDPDRDWYIQNWPQYQQQRSANETPEDRMSKDVEQARMDELCRKFSDFEAQKLANNHLLLSRLTEQQVAFGKGATHLEELRKHMFQNGLSQKGVTPEMYAEAYEKETVRMQEREQQNQSQQNQSQRGGYDSGRGRGRGRGGRGGGGGGGMWMGGASMN